MAEMTFSLQSIAYERSSLTENKESSKLTTDNMDNRESRITDSDISTSHKCLERQR